jgi:hypothetical protein
MRNLLSLLLILASLKGISQSSSITTGKWKIGVQFSTDFNEVPDRISGETVFGYYNVKPYGLNFTTGITAEFLISPNWQFSSGLMYSDKDITGTPYCETCFTMDMLLLQPPSPFELRYVEMPVLVRYVLSGRKLNIFTETGLNGSYLVKAPDVPFVDEDDWTKFLLSGHLGIGAGGNLGRGFDLNVNFSYRYSFLNLMENQDFKLRSFSITTALRYRL